MVKWFVTELFINGARLSILIHLSAIGGNLYVLESNTVFRKKEQCMPKVAFFPYNIQMCDRRDYEGNSNAHQSKIWYADGAIFFADRILIGRWASSS